MEKKVIDLSKETGTIEILLPSMENTETVYGEKRISGVPWTTKQPDKLVIFTKKDPLDLVPKSWEEMCKRNYEKTKEFYIDSDSLVEETTIVDVYESRNCCATKEDAEAFVALIQLRRLWHEWVKVLGEPHEDTWFDEDTDPEGTQMNYVVTTRGCGDDLFPTWEATFQTRGTGGLLFREVEHVEKFIECFPALLEKAKILL